MEKSRKSNEINSIKRAIKILNLYKGDIKYLGITDISKAINLHKTTVHRIVKTLESEGWLVQNKHSEKYRLGFKILNIASEIRNQYDFKEIILEEMESLCNQVDETVMLSVYTKNGGICLEKVETKAVIKLTSQPGRNIPLHCGATGKILLAYAPEEDVNQLIKNGLKKYTENTVTDGEVLIKQLKDIKRKGYVISKAENDDGALGIGAPIFDDKKNLLYGLSIAGPIERVETKGVDLLLKKVIDSAENISKKIYLLR
ncbi:IclR family transcriptional regulator [Maledivibacter halophilus]|uniref:Glycerol operon regulatory protein n=1 Tax=Maledivibacter halophilus TaxID=36842 RepID=A0A1T5JR65_9FIRM|nr:IclR family transcriptional regulator [Maledivibacter halophilus]SKC53921.1 transcriptional regulator, IclR family [Maledivibacter halophilus]